MTIYNIPQFRQKLKPDLTILKQTSQPKLEFIQPLIRRPGPVAGRGITYGGIGTMPYAPDEFHKEFGWIDRQTLNDNDVNYWDIGGQRWYYNMTDFVFYTADNTQQVEAYFSVPPSSCRFWEKPKIRRAMQAVLALCTPQSLPSQQQVNACFTADVCDDIYRKAYVPEKNKYLPREEHAFAKSIKSASISVVETIRNTLEEQLRNKHAEAIMKMPGFKSFVKRTKGMSKMKAPDQVRQYLTTHRKRLVPQLGEKFGLIRNATLLIRATNRRDSVRHNRDIKAFVNDPKQIVKDIAAILEVSPRTNSKAFWRLVEKHDQIARHMDDMSRIEEILQAYWLPNEGGDKICKYNRLATEKVFDKHVIDQVVARVQKYNDVAHNNPHKNETWVEYDTEIADIRQELENIHDQRMRAYQVGGSSLADLRPRIPCEERYPSGELQAAYTLNGNGQKQGLALTFYPNGTVCTRGLYENGKKQGEHETFYPDRKVLSRCLYQDGKENGLCQVNYPDGKPKERKNYKNGLLEGSYSERYPNGQWAVKCAYKNGRLEGPCIWYQPDGTVWSKGTYHDGVREPEPVEAPKKRATRVARHPKQVIPNSTQHTR